MSQKSKNRYFSGLLSLFLGTGLPAYALGVDCFSPLPDREKETEPTRLSQKERMGVLKLLHGMEHGWKGRAEGYYCFGTERAVRKKRDDATIKVRIEADSAPRVKITADFHSAERRVRRRENMDLFVREGYLRLDAAGAAGNVELVALSDHELTLKKSHRVCADNGCKTTVRQTLVKTLTLRGSSLVIEHLVYTNRVLSSQSTWYLKKSR